MAKRKHYSPELKAKIPLAAMRGDRMIVNLASRYGVHPNMLTTWKRVSHTGAAANEKPRVELNGFRVDPKTGVPDHALHVRSRQISQANLSADCHRGPGIALHACRDVGRCRRRA